MKRATAGYKMEALMERRQSTGYGVRGGIAGTGEESECWECCGGTAGEESEEYWAHDEDTKAAE